MEYIERGTMRLAMSLMASAALALTSLSATAQVRKPALQKEPEKAEKQEPAPKPSDRFRRLPEGLTEVADGIPQADRTRKPDCSGTQTVRFLPIDLYPLLPVRGDTELGGSPDMEISASITHTAGRVLLSGYVSLDEPVGGCVFCGQGGDTTFKGNFALDSIVPRPGCVIDKVTPSSGKIVDLGTYHHDWDTFYGSELIESANCRLDTSGDDGGQVGCKDVKVRPIEVSYREATEARKCEPVQVQPRIGAIFPTQPMTGPFGRDMDGHRVNVRLDTRAVIQDMPDGKGQELRIKTVLQLAEVAKRSTRAEGEGGQRNVFLTAFDAPGCRIVDVSPASGTLRAKSSAGDHNFQKYGGGVEGEASGMIDFANCRTDTRGEDSGKIGCTEIAYKTLTVTLESE